MGRIRLEISSWISDAFGDQSSEQLVLEENIEEDITIGDLIRKLASKHRAFSDIIFDTKTDKLSGYVAIVLNDRIVVGLEGLSTNIKDGDIIKLLPVIAGG